MNDHGHSVRCGKLSPCHADEEVCVSSPRKMHLEVLVKARPRRYLGCNLSRGPLRTLAISTFADTSCWPGSRRWWELASKITTRLVDVFFYGRLHSVLGFGGREGSLQLTFLSRGGEIRRNLFLVIPNRYVPWVGGVVVSQPAFRACMPSVLLVDAE